MTALRADEGQALVLSVLMLTMLLGVCALVIDVGAWFRASRAAQATADAAALAGAQVLPDDPDGAVELAIEYGAKNGGGVDAGDVSLVTRSAPNDAIRVEASRAAPSLLARVLGLGGVDVAGHATADARPLASARYVAPIAVDERNPLLQCRPVPCFGQETTLTLGTIGPGAFGLVNLDQTPPAPPSETLLAAWLRSGYDDTIGTGAYQSAPGTKFNSIDFKTALAERAATEVLLPVYRSFTGGGATGVYDVVGWVGFRISAFSGSGSSGTLTGRFVAVTWTGEPVAGASGSSFGARTVSLVG